MKPVVTLIVPAYNPPRGHFIECCRSINDQTTDYAFEVIVVDDYSNSDVASEILEACKHFGFDLIRNEKNLGVSSSRNKAMLNANGDYIAFIDADDCIYPDFIEDSVNLAMSTGCDCVIGDLILTSADAYLPKRCSEDAEPCIFEEFDVVNVMAGVVAGEDFMPQSVAKAKSFVHAGPVARLYRSERIKTAGLQFDSSLICGEDIKFNLDFLALASSCVTTKKVWYQYKQHTNSATNSVKPKQFNGQIDFCVKLIKNETIRQFGLEQVAYGRILGGLKTLIRRVAANSPNRGQALKEILRLITMDVFQTAYESINLALFKLSAQDKVFVLLCRKKLSMALFYLSKLVLFAKRICG